MSVRAWVAGGCLGLALVVGGELGCRHRDVIIKTAEGKKLRAEDIDRDPLALLPGGAIAVVYLDTQQLYRSPFGQKVLEVARAQAPVPPAANYDPARDLQRLYVGVYSMSGVDFAGVATGTFDQVAIERASDGVQTTPMGLPVVRSTYAGRTLYTAANLGFVVLTAHTALFGNETGIRRVLDRIESGRVARDVPGWAKDLLERPEAPMAAAVDLEVNPVSEAVREQLPFTRGLNRVRVVGNFQDPGINLAGTAVYVDAANAERGAAELNQIHDFVKRWGWAAAIVGMQQPIRRLEAKPAGKQVDVVVGLDAQAVAALLDQAARTVPRSLAGGTP